MIVDLHAHYPMHLRLPLNATVALMSRARGRPWGDRILAWILYIANRYCNYPRPGDPAVPPGLDLQVPLSAAGIGLVPPGPRRSRGHGASAHPRRCDAYERAGDRGHIRIA